MKKLIILLGFLSFNTHAKATFEPCPNKPNCVSSLDASVDHKIDPIIYKGSLEQAKIKLEKALLDIKRLKIVEREDHYWRAEAVSFLFKFVDDVEVLFDDDASVIHLKSASRKGYSDLGANKKRIKQIKQNFSQN